MGQVIISGGVGGGVTSDELTATLSDVLQGKTVVTKDSNDEIGTGTMMDYSGKSNSATPTLDTTNSRLQMTVGSTGKYDTSSKLYAAYSTIRTLIGLTAEKIISGNTILGLEGTATGDATLSSNGNLLNGVIAYGKNGIKYTGTMANKGAQTKTFTPSASSQSYTIPAGYHNGSGKVTCNAVSNLSAGNIKKGVVVGGVTGTWEGYVASPTDLYYYGQNKCGLTSDSSYAQFQDTQILIGYNSVTFTTNEITFTGYSKLNFLVQPCGLYSENAPIGVDISKPFSLDTEISGANSTQQKTISVSLTNFQSKGSLTFKLTNIGSTNGKGKLLRIWLS